MKFAVAILAVLAVASPLSALKLPASGSGTLAKELQSVVDMWFHTVLPRTYQKDVFAALQILQSNEFKLLVRDVEAIPEVKNLLNYTQEAGLDVRTLINKLTDTLDLSHISPLGNEQIAECRGLKRLANACYSELSWADIRQTGELFRNSTVLTDFARELTKLEFDNIYLSISSNEHYVKLTQQAEQAGIFSAECRKYYFQIMLVKIDLAHELSTSCTCA